MEGVDKLGVLGSPLLQNQEEVLPTADQERASCVERRARVIEEVQRLLWLAGPLISVNLLQYCIQLISIMFVGHLGELSLSSASMATAFATSTSFSVLLGMGSALETLCGQAYGAKQSRILGIYMQRAMVILLATCIPLSLIWYYTTAILVAFHQDHQISIGAGTFLRWMIPSLFAYAILQCFNRFLQTQKIVFPMMITSAVTAACHIPLCWLLVYKSGLGSNGAALANSISNWNNVLLLIVYVKYSSTCSETWTGFSKDAFKGLISFLKLAIPSAVMICLENWSFNMVVILAGLLPKPTLEVSVLSISLSTTTLAFMVSVGLSGAISTRVSNELGAGNALGARMALYVVIVITISLGSFMALVTILVRDVWGKLYSKEEEVIKYVARIMLLLALSNFLDSIQCVLSGAARGCGWQKICACINLGAYCVVAIPAAVLFAFVLGIGGMGLWMGIICGLIVQNVALVTTNLCTNWDQEARRAVIRVCDS